MATDDHRTKANFILQQGLPPPDAGACPTQYSALQFQPRIVAAVVLAGALAQSAIAFAALGVVLWWSAALPGLNPFDAIYNAALARADAARLGPAQAPRRFAQFLAGAFCVAIAASLHGGWRVTAYALEAALLLAVGALVFGGFCLGSYLFLVATGRAEFAHRTLPWSRG